MLQTTTKGRAKEKVSMKLMASLAPARAEVEAWVVAKADQYRILTILTFSSACCSESPDEAGFVEDSLVTEM